jgi:DNA adenine methylase
MKSAALDLPLSGLGTVFPETKYMGSKRRLLPEIVAEVTKLAPRSVLDGFSGSACVAHAFKRAGWAVTANDMLSFCHHIAAATVANDDVRFEPRALTSLLRPAPRAATFIRDTFRGLYFNEEDNEFLDHLLYRITRELEPGPLRSLALASAARACIQKRPRGLFTFTGLEKGQDGRRDLRLPLREHFIRALEAFSSAIFSNNQPCKAHCGDVFALASDTADVVYLDPPYVGVYSDCDYTRRYHFVEGFCRSWQGVEIDTKTTTQKIRSLPTAFSRPAEAEAAFERLFAHFSTARLVVSYSSNSVPDRDTMTKLLRATGRRVRVREIPLRYHQGNQGHLEDRSRSQVMEYLFIAT